MTDAEKMREAAAKAVCKRADDYSAEFGRYDPSTGVVEYPGNGEEWMEEWESIAAMIRALPVDASAPAADCQQAGLVTVGAGLLDEVKAELRAAEDALADSQWSGGSAERRVSAAIARLEREVG